MKKLKICIVGLIVLLFLGAFGIQLVLAKDVVLNFASWHFLEPGRGETLSRLLDKFEELNPGIKINREKIPNNSYTKYRSYSVFFPY